jgi:hypothetical protein
MLPLVTLPLIVYYLWRGGALLGVLLMSAGLVVHSLMLLRIVRATAGGVGGHAEWVRDTSTRPRLARHPAWVVGIALVVAGLVVANVP